MSSAGQVWHLERYARYKQTPRSSQTLDFQDYYDNQKEELKLIVDQGSLLLLHGKSIMESYLLSNAKACLTGVCKGDTMRVTYKMKKDRIHSFRMKFAKNGGTGEDVCRKCAQYLSSYFPVKLLSASETEAKATSAASFPESVLSGEVTLASFAEAMTGDPGVQLPKLYNDISTFDDKDLNTFLKLCLTDPGFPAFVGKVEEELTNIKKENYQSNS